MPAGLGADAARSPRAPRASSTRGTALPRARAAHPRRASESRGSPRGSEVGWGGAGTCRRREFYNRGLRRSQASRRYFLVSSFARNAPTSCTPAASRFRALLGLEHLAGRVARGADLEIDRDHPGAPARGDLRDLARAPLVRLERLGDLLEQPGLVEPLHAPEQRGPGRREQLLAQPALEHRLEPLPGLLVLELVGLGVRRDEPRGDDRHRGEMGESGRVVHVAAFHRGTRFRPRLGATLPCCPTPRSSSSSDPSRCFSSSPPRTCPSCSGCCAR